LWPDADEPGHTAMESVAATVISITSASPTCSVSAGRRAVGDDPFGPLTNPPPQGSGPSDEPVPLVPVPAGAPPPPSHHYLWGPASCLWKYTDRQLGLIGYVARFDTAAGKQILPLSFCRSPDGTLDWRWKSFAKPRPLFGLQYLAMHPQAPVLIVEGEKTACAASMIFRKHVVLTWPGGAEARHVVDWTPLAGRNVSAVSFCERLCR